LAIVAAAMMAIGGAFYFEPWTLFTSSSVNESLPEISTSEEQVVAPPVESEPIDSSQEEIEPEIAYPITLASGDLISHEHETSGQVLLLELEDGSRILRIEDLDTSDGPKLEVWLADAPVIEGFEGWFVFDDGQYQNLGDLKATQGNQNYEIPEGLDLDQYSSVSIWCSRFAVSFGAAELRT